MSADSQHGASKKTETSHPRAAQGLIVLVSLVTVWLAAGSPLGHVADNNAADAFFRWFPATQADRESISTLLAIDEATLSAHGGVRRLRSTVTEAIEAMAKYPPKVLAIDLTLADPGDTAEDARLAAALAKLPHVVMGVEIRSDAGQWEQPPAALLPPHAVLGHVHAAPDPMDAVCREIPLEKAVNTQRYWALSLEALRLWRDEEYLLETPHSLMVGSIEIPARRDTGRLLRIRFLPPQQEGGLSSMRRLSVADLLGQPDAAKTLRGGVVFLGVTAPSAARDRLMTPYSYGRSMQGVEIHANAFETLASGRFLRPVRPAMLLLGGLVLACLVWWGFALFEDWRAHAIAAVALVSALILPAAAFVQSNLASATVLAGSAWLPFLGLAAHRYWFVDRKLQRATRETENYRNAIHYVTHEMRTPLTAIQGSSELISRYRLGEDKQKQIATMIHSESKRLGRLIQMFLDVERLSAGEMQLRMERFPAQALAETCLQRALPLAENKGIQLIWSAEDGPAVEVRGDRELLEHALYNLVTNAIKYSSAGTTVRVRAANGNGMLRLAVADEGMGLSAEEQKVIFRKFYRTKGAEQSGERGSGIGLAIVEQIVAAHNGQIHLTSTQGKGSTFTLLLPQESRP